MMYRICQAFAIAKGMAETATIGVLTISLFNSFGRLFWGWVSDKLGRKRTLVILLGGTASCRCLLTLRQDIPSTCDRPDRILLRRLFKQLPALDRRSVRLKIYGDKLWDGACRLRIGAVVASYIAGYFKYLAVNDISLMFPAFIIAAIAAAVGILLISTVKKPGRSES